MDFSDSFERSMRRAEEHVEQLKNEFDRLSVEPCMKDANIGDRVVVACGLIGMGHQWVRREAVVIEKGDTSYCVRFKKEFSHDDVKEKWIHRLLVTDVLSSSAEPDYAI